MNSTGRGRQAQHLCSGLFLLIRGAQKKADCVSLGSQKNNASHSSRKKFAYYIKKRKKTTMLEKESANIF